MDDDTKRDLRRTMRVTFDEPEPVEWYIKSEIITPDKVDRRLQNFDIRLIRHSTSLPYKINVNIDRRTRFVHEDAFKDHTCIVSVKVGYTNRYNASYDHDTVIMANAFQGCSELTTVSLANVKHINMRAFERCFRLQRCFLGERVRRISIEAFAFTDIQEIEFPSTLIYIGTQAFYDNKRLERVTFKTTNGPQYLKLSGFVFAGCTRLRVVSLPRGKMEMIGNNAFAIRLSSLTHITLPFVQTIGATIAPLARSLFVVTGIGQTIDDLAFYHRFEPGHKLIVVKGPPLGEQIMNQPHMRISTVVTITPRQRDHGLHTTVQVQGPALIDAENHPGMEILLSLLTNVAVTGSQHRAALRAGLHGPSGFSTNPQNSGGPTRRTDVSTLPVELGGVIPQTTMTSEWPAKGTWNWLQIPLSRRIWTTRLKGIEGPKYLDLSAQ
jgi:hypothetical protein